MTERLDAFHPHWEPSREKNALMLLLLHGTGGDEHQLVPLARQIMNGRPASLLGIRGRVKEGSSNRFFRRIREGVFDEKDLVARAHELAGALDDAQAEYGFEPDRVIAVGYSNGANMAASLLLLHLETLGGAILFRAMMPLEPETIPAVEGKWIAILEGESDPWAPADQGERLAEILRNGGAEVKFSIRTGGHDLTEQDITIASEWLATKPF
ncbi:MAG: alpha/beta hydrolase [bacterium]